jgi:hypothetical protein
VDPPFFPTPFSLSQKGDLKAITTLEADVKDVVRRASCFLRKNILSKDSKKKLIYMLNHFKTWQLSRI